MKASDFDELTTVICNTCGKEFHSENGKNPWKQLAGHILSSNNHPDKRWAVGVLYGAGSISRNDFLWR